MKPGHAIYIAKALVWSCIAAAVVGGIFFETGLDRLIVGFLAGCAFAGVLAFLNSAGKGRFLLDGTAAARHL